MVFAPGSGGLLELVRVEPLDGVGGQGRDAAVELEQEGGDVHGPHTIDRRRGRDRDGLLRWTPWMRGTRRTGGAG